MRYEQMKEQYEELSKIIGKESADKWNELPQDVEDYNRAGRMSVVVVVIIAMTG